MLPHLMRSIHRVDQKAVDKLADKLEEPKYKKSSRQWRAIRQAIDRPESGLAEELNPRFKDLSTGGFATTGVHGSVSADRRATRRLPIERAVRYKVLGGKRTATQVGSGKTLDMSSRGILFTTESALARGALVELAISWPVRLNDVVPLKLVTVGRLVRVEANQAAVAIERYEFKTSGSNGP